MRPFEQYPFRIASLGGLIAVSAIAVLAYSATGSTASSAAAGSPAGVPAAAAFNGDIPIRPFKVTTSEEALADLRRRINATKWPERETVADTSQGVQLATMQKLAR